MTAATTVAARFRPAARRIKTAIARRRRFLSEIRGTTAVEFAMISVPFIGLVGAIFETGTIYFRTAQLQMATESASRAVLTHSTAAGITYQQFVDQSLCTWQSGGGTVKPGSLGQMFDCSKLIVDISSPTDWSSASSYTSNSFTATPRTSAINMPGPGQIAIVRVVYPVSPIMGFLGGGVFAGNTYGQIRTGQTKDNNGTWSYMIMGIAAFRVEPSA